MTDELSERYGDLLKGSYDCVDRIVLNAYDGICYSPGGFRTWWRRLHGGSDDNLDDTHLMRMAGRFSRRVRAFAKARGIRLIDCRSGERKHEIAAEHLATHPVSTGVFLILVARAPAPVWEVQRSKRGAIANLRKKLAHVNHYSFHIMDPEWGHLTIKMSGHPPFGAQIILNGHEYVGIRASQEGIGFAKEGNCFTRVSDAAGLRSVADTLSDVRTVGRLAKACERWIYSACLCFALDSEERERSGFRYRYSIYQAEYSRNLLFRSGAKMEQVFQAMVDRTRARLDVPTLKTLFGAKRRPHRDRKQLPAPRLEVVVERSRYDLTVFKLHFGALTLKAYTKGEHVLRFEAVVHNTVELGVGRVIARFPDIVTRLAEMLERFLTTLDCVDRAFVSGATLDQLPLPTKVGNTRVGGVDLNKARHLAALQAVLALAPSPAGFTVAQFAAKVNEISAQTGYTTRQAAYDIKKLRGKKLLERVGTSRRYHATPQGLRTIAALLVLRDHVIKPILAGVAHPRRGRRSNNPSPIDDHYRNLRLDMRALFKHCGIAA